MSKKNKNNKNKFINQNLNESKIYRNVNDNLFHYKNFLGFYTNKHGNLVFNYNENKKDSITKNIQEFNINYINKSIRLILYLFNDGEFCYYVRLQNENYKDSFLFIPLKKGECGSYFSKRKNGFEPIPSKNCNIHFDCIFRMKIQVFKKIFSVTDDFFQKTKPINSTKLIVYLRFLYDNIEINKDKLTYIEMPENIEDYKIDRFKKNDIFQIPFSELSKVKTDLYVNFGKVIYSTEIQLKKEFIKNTTNSNVATFNDNHGFLISKKLKEFSTKGLNELESFKKILYREINQLLYVNYTTNFSQADWTKIGQIKVTKINDKLYFASEAKKQTTFNQKEKQNKSSKANLTEVIGTNTLSINIEDSNNLKLKTASKKTSKKSTKVTLKTSKTKSATKKTTKKVDSSKKTIKNKSTKTKK